MAQEKIDDREVAKIRAAIARDGQKKATTRFDENSPEFRKAVQDRQRTQAAGARQRRLLQTEAAQRPDGAFRAPSQQKETHTKEDVMSNDQQQTPAARRKGTPQRTAAQERAVAMRQRQARRNTQIREQNAKNRAQGQGQSL